MWWQICIHLQVVVSGVGSIVTVNWYCSVLQSILAGLKSQQSQKNRQLTARWCSFQEPGKLSLSKHGLYLSNPEVYHHILIRSPQENMAIQWFPKYIYQYIYIYNYIYIYSPYISHKFPTYSPSEKCFEAMGPVASQVRCSPGASLWPPGRVSGAPQPQLGWKFGPLTLW